MKWLANWTFLSDNLWFSADKINSNGASLQVSLWFRFKKGGVEIEYADSAMDVPMEDYNLQETAQEVTILGHFFESRQKCWIL